MSPVCVYVCVCVCVCVCLIDCEQVPDRVRVFAKCGEIVGS